MRIIDIIKKQGWAVLTHVTLYYYNKRIEATKNGLPFMEDKFDLIPNNNELKNEISDIATRIKVLLEYRTCNTKFIGKLKNILNDRNIENVQIEGNIRIETIKGVKSFSENISKETAAKNIQSLVQENDDLTWKLTQKTQSLLETIDRVNFYEYLDKEIIVYQEFLNTLNTDQIVALINILISFSMLTILINIGLILLTGYILESLKSIEKYPRLTKKYPRLTKYLHITLSIISKLKKPVLKVNIIILILLIIFCLAINTYIFILPY